ncbi:RHS repeat domain-containing protein [Acinetobacter sp. KB005]|uniref:RHS repeat domain-containing protein n=1 Tax=Acinetobacter sp. KB005 TaxID=3416667 RepID=UPI003CE6EEB1
MLNHKKYLVTMILTIMYSNSHAGRFEMIHSAVKQPGLENCTPYRDLLGNEFDYSVNDISGPIPYTRTYQTALSQNLNRNREITDGLKTIGGWQDNFNHYLILFDEGNTSSGDLRILLRLRFLNEHDETFYIGGLGADKKLGKISRIFSSMPLYYEAYLAATGNGQREDADRIGFHSENHRDKGLVLNQPSGVFSDGKSVNNVKNLSFTLYKDGNKYTLSHISTFGSDAIYKITAAELSTGQNLKFKYNASDAGLVKVVDQYGNFLTIERNKKDPDTAYAALSYPTKVIAGKYATKSNTIDDYLNRTPTETELADGKVQQADYFYEEFDWANHLNGNKEKIYAISAVNSTNNPNERYTYTKVGNVNQIKSLNEPAPSGPEFFVPVLTRAYHREFREYGADFEVDIANFDYKQEDSRLWFSYPFSSSKAGIKRASVVKTGGTEKAYQGYNSTRRLNFISKDNTADKDFDPMYIDIRGDHRERDMYIDFGGYPCVTYNNTPIQRAGFDVLTSDLKYVIDRNGNATAFQYDDFGRLSTLIEAERDEALKRTTTYTYSPDVKRFQTPLKIERKDETIVNTLDSKGRVTSSTVTNTNGGVTKSKKSTYQYENDLLKSQTDPDGSIKTLEYEDIGVNKKKETITKDGLSSVTEYSNYNSAGAPRKIIEPSGVIQDISYNQSNLPTVKARTDPASGLVQANNYEYNFNHDVITENKGDGLIKQYRYSLDDGLLSSFVERDQFLKNNYTYNANGQLISETEQYINYNHPLLPDTVGELRDKASYVYDRLGNLTESKYGSDGTANWQKKEYDANGNVLKIIKPNAEGTESVESFTYDGLNRKKTYTDPLGKIYSYNYDSFDNATLKKASNGSNSTNSYTSGKDLAKETNSDYGVKEYTYDGVSNLLTSKHASTRYCNYLSYDVLDHYKQSNCQHVNQTASSKDVNYKYNYHTSRFGRLDKIESQNKTGFTDGQRYWGGNTEYSYDGLDRVIAKQQRAGRLQAADKKLTVSYGYTQGDRIKEITYPSGKKVNYNYAYTEISNIIVGDPRLQGVSLGDQSILTLGYNDINLVSSMKWGNGNTTDYVYDSVKNITNITNKVNNADYDSIVNSYYKNGLLQTKKIGSQTRTYKYDKKGQLLQELLTGGYTHTFSYDDNGNRKTFSSSGIGSPYPITSASYTYSTSGNKYATMTHNNAAQSFSYNATGELNLPNILGTAIYDYQGRRATEGATPDGKYTSHEIDYNHKNQRILTARNGSTRQYVYDEADHLLGEYDGNGQALVEYIWLGDKPVSAIYGDKIVYLLTDEKNTPYRGIDSATNNKVWVRNSDAFGVAKPTVETVEMNLRFPGQVYDKATGLHYNLNRYYNPLLGRYMEADPIGLEGGWNPYAYAMNDPVNKVDPKGLWAVSGSLYVGWGGGAEISFNNGSLEAIARLGVGVGAGLSLDTAGGPSIHTKPTGYGPIGRTSAKGDIAIGVGNVGVSLVGVNAISGNGFVQKEGGGKFEATGPTINLDIFKKDQHFKTGVSIGGAISAELGGYTNLKMPQQKVQPKLEKKTK